MTSNPLYNAGAALLYIIFIVSVLSAGSHFAEKNPQDNILMPIGMLSLFVLSAAVMAYIVMYQPVIMLLDGKRKEAVSLFLRTISIFAAITFVVLFASIAISYLA